MPASRSFASSIARLRLAAGALVAAAAVAACGEPTANVAPIIDSVEAPHSVTARDGVYSVPVTILFHDDDSEVVTHVRYRLDPTLDEMTEIPLANPLRQSAEVLLQIPASACGDRDVHYLEISVLDGRGAESTPLPRAIQLK